MNLLKSIVKKLGTCTFCYSPFHKENIHNTTDACQEFLDSNLAKVESIYFRILDVMMRILSPKEYKLTKLLAEKSIKHYD